MTEVLSVCNSVIHNICQVLTILISTGYGVSSGKPSEKNLYSDIQAAWDALRTRYGISPENIILYGQSIGKFSKSTPYYRLAFQTDSLLNVL